jgi:hypothetical protein
MCIAAVCVFDPHKSRLLGQRDATPQQEVRWHVAQMLPRLALTLGERDRAAATLIDYLRDPSSIERTFAMQALADLARHARRVWRAPKRAERCGEGDRRAATPEPSWTPGGYAAGGTGAGDPGLGSTAPWRISPPTWFARANSGSRLPPGVERPKLPRPLHGTSSVTPRSPVSEPEQLRSDGQGLCDGPRETCSACLMAWPPR